MQKIVVSYTNSKREAMALQYDNPPLAIKLPPTYFLNKTKYWEMPSSNDPVVNKGVIQPFSPKDIPPIDDVVFRRLAELKTATVETITNHTGYPLHKVRRSIRVLCNQGKVCCLGEVMGHSRHEAPGRIYGIRLIHVPKKKKRIYYAGNFLDTHVLGYSYCKRDPGPKWYRTTEGYKVLRHRLNAGSATGKVVAGLNALMSEGLKTDPKQLIQTPFICLMEHTLRALLGFHNTYSKDKTYQKCRKIYNTPVPDAIIPIPQGCSLWVEYFRSVPRKNDISVRLQALPQGAKMLAIIESEHHDGVSAKRIANVLGKFEKKNFGLYMEPRLHVITLPIDSMHCINTPIGFEAKALQKEVLDKSFQADLENLWNKILKDSTRSREILASPSDEALDVDMINIREFAMHLGQGWFLHQMRSPRPRCKKIYNFMGEIPEINIQSFSPNLPAKTLAGGTFWALYPPDAEEKPKRIPRGWRYWIPPEYRRLMDTDLIRQSLPQEVLADMGSHIVAGEEITINRDSFLSELTIAYPAK